MTRERRPCADCGSQWGEHAWSTLRGPVYCLACRLRRESAAVESRVPWLPDGLPDLYSDHGLRF